MIRFYHRTEDGAISYGVLLESLRRVWPLIVVCLLAGALISAVTGHPEDLLIAAAVALGIRDARRRTR